jgi:hypothetical protein
MIKILPFEIFHEQLDEGRCGPNALKHVLHNKYGIYLPEKRIADISNCSQKNGSSVKGILKVADTFNLNYQLKHNSSIQDLIDSVINENPIIILMQAWPSKKISDWLNTWHLGHYDVIHGFDTFKEKIYYYDPLDGIDKDIRYKNLDERWHDIDLKTNTVYDHFGIFFQDQR